MMTASGQRTRIVAFGDPASSVWGVALVGSDPALVAARLDAAAGAPAAAEAAFEPAELELGGDESWRLTSRSRAIELSPLNDQGPVARGLTGAEADAGELELCAVSGREVATGVNPSLSTGGGVRCSFGSGERVGSIRLMAAWFPAGAVALAAVRPVGGRGHDRDTVVAAIAGEREGISVFEPRLSTTYAGDGTPIRAGLELWLGESEDGEQFPRRVAGERSGPFARHGPPPQRVEAYGLRCHARGEDGIGVYVLMRGR